MTKTEVCEWCGYMNDHTLVENEYDHNNFTCSCCGLEDVEIYEG